MKKRLLAVLLSFTMVFSMLPTAVYAEDIDTAKTQSDSQEEAPDKIVVGTENGETDQEDPLKLLQDRIWTLPDAEEFEAAEEDQQNAIYLEAQTIAEEYEQLSAEDQERLDVTRLMELFDYFNSLVEELSGSNCLAAVELYANTPAGAAASGITYVGREDTEYAESANAPTSTGKYTAKVSVGGVTAVKDFEITKAPSDANVTFAEGLAYNGKNQYLVERTTTVGGTLMYRLSDAEEWQAGLVMLSKKDAGDYTIQYYVKGDANHNDSEVKTATVTIQQKELTVSGVTIQDTLKIVAKEGGNFTGVRECSYTIAKANEKPVNPPNVPQTGDNSQASLWITLMLVSICGMAGVILVSKKTRNKGKNIK